MPFIWHFTIYDVFVSLTIITGLYLLGVGHSAGSKDTIVNKQKGIVIDVVDIVVRANNSNAVPF